MIYVPLRGENLTNSCVCGEKYEVFEEDEEELGFLVVGFVFPAMTKLDLK